MPSAVRALASTLTAPLLLAAAAAPVLACTMVISRGTSRSGHGGSRRRVRMPAHATTGRIGAGAYAALDDSTREHESPGARRHLGSATTMMFLPRVRPCSM
jgi:hypothetical protein